MQDTLTEKQSLSIIHHPEVSITGSWRCLLLGADSILRF
jgi:hypothetical protein